MPSFMMAFKMAATYSKIYSFRHRNPYSIGNKMCKHIKGPYGIQLLYERPNEKVTRWTGVALTTEVNRLHTPHSSLVDLFCCCK